MKRVKEQIIVDMMIDLYCKKHHHSESCCIECSALKGYVHQRLAKCPFGDEKNFCSNCTIHCYQKEQQERIKRIMRFSGPRMLLHHPKVALCHVLQTRRQRRKKIGEQKNGKK